MKMNHSITIKNINQSAQSGNYWLISVELCEELDSIDAFYYLDEAPQQALSLFDYQFPKLQLLSQTPLPETLLAADSLQLKSSDQSTVNLQTEQATLLLASDLGMGPLFYYAKQIKSHPHKSLALLHSTEAFPFIVKPAQIMLEDFPDQAIGSCPLLEDWKIANRLASDLGLAGCFDGALVDLFDYWLSTESQRHLKDETRAHWQVLSFLPERCNQQLKEHVSAYPWLTLQIVNTP